jgi:hypothetical protein
MLAVDSLPEFLMRLLSTDFSDQLGWAVVGDRLGYQPNFVIFELKRRLRSVLADRWCVTGQGSRRDFHRWCSLHAVLVKRKCSWVECDEA